MLLGVPHGIPNDREWTRKRDAFCSNPTCRLHVRAGDPGVKGAGNWAELAEGLIIGRGIYQGAYLCDPCGKALLAGSVTLDIVAPPAPRPPVELHEQQVLDLSPA